MYYMRMENISVHQIFSMKGERTFLLLLYFLITGLCNSSDNSLTEMFSFLIPLPEVFLSNIYKPLNQVHGDIHYIFDFFKFTQAMSC